MPRPPVPETKVPKGQAGSSAGVVKPWDACAQGPQGIRLPPSRGEGEAAERSDKPAMTNVILPMYILRSRSGARTAPTASESAAPAAVSAPAVAPSSAAEQQPSHARATRAVAGTNTSSSADSDASTEGPSDSSPPGSDDAPALGAHGLELPKSPTRQSSQFVLPLDDAQLSIPGLAEPAFVGIPHDPVVDESDTTDDSPQLSLFETVQHQLRELRSEFPRWSQEALLLAPDAPHILWTSDVIRDVAEVLRAQDADFRRLYESLNVIEGPFSLLLGVSAFTQFPAALVAPKYDRNCDSRQIGGNGFGQLAGELRDWGEPYGASWMCKMLARYSDVWMGFATWHEDSEEAPFVQMRQKKDGTSYPIAYFGKEYERHCGRTILYFPAGLYREAYRRNEIQIVVRALYRCLKQTNTRGYQLARSLLKLSRRAQRQYVSQATSAPQRWSYLDAICWSKQETGAFKALGKKVPHSRSLSRLALKAEKVEESIARKNRSLQERSSNASPVSRAHPSCRCRTCSGARDSRRAPASPSTAGPRRQGKRPVVRERTPSRGGPSTNSSNTPDSVPPVAQDARYWLGWCSEHPGHKPALCIACGVPLFCRHCDPELKKLGKRCDPCFADDLRPCPPDALLLSRAEWFRQAVETTSRWWQQRKAEAAAGRARSKGTAPLTIEERERLAGLTGRRKPWREPVPGPVVPAGGRQQQLQLEEPGPFSNRPLPVRRPLLAAKPKAPEFEEVDTLFSKRMFRPADVTDVESPVARRGGRRELARLNTTDVVDVESEPAKG